MCVLDNTAQGLGQGKKQAHLEGSWHGAWSTEKEARREVIYSFAVVEMTLSASSSS
jgi:hypothetical protein